MDITNKIKNEISKSGPIPINTFMEKVLNASDDSYYQSKKQILGFKGDFITAPEISQLFGEIIGVWLCLKWSEKLKGKKFNLCELGPGKGTLMSDLLRSISKTSDIMKFIDQIQLFEINKNLIRTQKQNLSKYKQISWHENPLFEIKSKVNIIIANEFFDALPVIQYIKRQKRWYELMVNLRSDSADLYVSDEAIDEKTQDMLQEEYAHIPIDGIIEIAQDSKSILKEICQKISKHGGSCIIIDYGFIENDRNIKSYISTLQAIKEHKYHDIFKNIGEADLTTQVNFSQLIDTAQTYGCKTHYMTQGEFLKFYGIELRKEILKKSAQNTKLQRNIESEYKRLVSSSEMGNLFKVLIID
ncbi:MAG: SAM-dependent methyltransferase [Rickettsiales bacterium]